MSEAESSSAVFYETNNNGGSTNAIPEQRPSDHRKPSLSQQKLLEELGVISHHAKGGHAIMSEKVDLDLINRARPPAIEVPNQVGSKEKDVKEMMLESLAHKRESEVEELVKESVGESSLTSVADAERLEEEIEARVMRKLLQERQRYILQNDEEEEEHKTEIEETTTAAPTPSSEHLLLPTSIPAQSKLQNAELVTTQGPGAVRVAGMNSVTVADDEVVVNEEEEFTDQNDEENPPPMTDHSQMTEMQMPQPTVPDYFHDQIMLEATLVTESVRNSTNHSRRTNQSGGDGRLVVEAQPVIEEDDQPKDLQCSDVIKSKKLCSRIVLAIILCVALLCSILLPLAREQTNKRIEESKRQRNQPPFQDGLEQPTIDALQNPNTPQSQANAWILKDPSFDSYTPERRLQRFAMAALFYGLDGPNWRQKDHWLSYDINECDWYMAHHQGNNTSCNVDGTLESLNLTSNQLNGTLPGELYYLEDVRFIDLSHNQLWGVPPPLSNPALQLEVVDLSYNSFSGFITAELGFENRNLRIMRNNYNQFDGLLEPMFGLAPNMEIFESAGNGYRGTLPTNIGNFVNMQVFQLADNYLEGTIPFEVGEMSSLRVFNVSINLLTGTIPSSIASMISLEMLDLRNNSLTGIVPRELCELNASGQVEFYVDCDDEVLRCCE